MSELRRAVVQALHDTRDGGTAVITDESGTGEVVQWTCSGPDGHIIEVPDPAQHHRPSLLRRLLGRAGPAPAGLGEHRIQALEQLGFSAGDHGPELEVSAQSHGHDQIVHLIVAALEILDVDGSRVSVTTF